MIIKRQKEFGKVKATNKALKRMWLESQGSRKGFLGIGKRTGDEAIRKSRETIKKEIEKGSSPIDFDRLYPVENEFASANHRINYKMKKAVNNPRFENKEAYIGGRDMHSGGVYSEHTAKGLGIEPQSGKAREIQKARRARYRKENNTPYLGGDLI